jgi:hypothetical protein
MRHAVVALVAVASGLGPVALPMPATGVEDRPSRTVAPPAAPLPAARTAGSPLCTITDHRATELSGLVATPSGYIAINDGQPDPAAIQIFYLDLRCGVVKTVHYPTPARDPEDLAVAPDGTLWVADTGDNITSDSRRQTVALWRVPAAGGTPVIYRLRYPDGPHDAESLLFGADGMPVIVTKELDRRSGLYRPTAALVPNTADGALMRRVGEFTPASTGENNPFGPIGEILVTGAATTPDRHRIALRTYSAAYEWDAPDGDVVKAITTTQPRVTALPDEPQGESVAYTPDGSAFLTVSDEPGPTVLRRYARSTTTLVPESTASASPTTAAARRTPRWLPRFPTGYAVAAAASGLGLVGVGLVGLHRNRRRRPDTDTDTDTDTATP